MFGACDKIEAPYVIEPEKPKTDKHVFLEYYTGHLDASAPASIQELVDLKEQYGDRLTIMSIHAGDNATTGEAPFNNDFKTETGDEYYTYFNISNSNLALIDRTEFDGNKEITPSDWETNIEAQLATDGELELSISPVLEESVLSGSVQLEMFKDINKQLSVQLYLVEDSVVAAQQDESGIIDNFLHRFVLRDVLNGTWGENLAAAEYVYGDEVNASIADYAIPSAWDKSKLSIVAMVYDQETKNVIQVAEKSINFEEDNTVPERVKRVLLEDFTGQKCVNCPKAHEIAHDLQNIYGDDELVVVAIHAGWFATPANEPFTYDFRTEAGNAYESYFSVQTYPTGMVNRVGSGGNYLIDKDGWGTAVAAAFENETSLEITIKPSISGNNIGGNVDLYFFEDFGTNAKIQIYVMEDNITSPQVTPEGDDLEYVHMHVLRGALNGDWGQDLPSASYSAEDRESISIPSYTMGDDWNPDELYIVAYVYDANTLEVLQVNKKKLN
jgi:hypothetical protein